MQDEWEVANQEWTKHVQPLCTAHPDVCSPSVCSLDKYLAARSVVTSRAFLVDTKHGEGLVPFADLFNHSTGEIYVLLQNDYFEMMRAADTYQEGILALHA